ncbi:1894_t:CDS:1, partial [Ambispora leptoticha]
NWEGNVKNFEIHTSYWSTNNKDIDYPTSAIYSLSHIVITYVIFDIVYAVRSANNILLKYK